MPSFSLICCAERKSTSCIFIQTNFLFFSKEMFGCNVVMEGVVPIDGKLMVFFELELFNANCS
jgi:hypothetical protein